MNVVSVYTLINQMSMVAVPLLASRDRRLTRLLTTKLVKLLTNELPAIFFIMRLPNSWPYFSSLIVYLCSCFTGGDNVLIPMLEKDLPDEARVGIWENDYLIEDYVSLFYISISAFLKKISQFSLSTDAAGYSEY